MLRKFDTLPLWLWQVGNIYDGAVRFGVPVFFMISGALLLNRDYQLKDFFAKRILRILPPFIFWSIAYVTFEYFILRGNSFELWDYSIKVVNGLLHGSRYHLWFVYVLIGLYLFVPILRKWIKNASDTEIKYFIFMWLVTFLYAAPVIKDYLPRITLLNFSGYIGYFVLGYYLSKLAFNNRFVFLSCIIFGFLVTVVGTYIATDITGSFHKYFYQNLSFNVALTSVGVFLLIKNYEFKSVVIKKCLGFLSEHSFGIYLCHIMVLNVLKLNGLNWNTFNPVISVPITALTCLIISSIIIYSGKKIKFFRILMG